MESSENRRQSDTLPSMSTYMGGFEGVAGESTRYHQQNSSINRTSISTASPISPTTTFGPTPPLSFPPPAPSHSGYNTPPDSRKTSRNEDCRQTLPPLAEGRQSLPSLSEALCRDDRFPAPSPMQTPPLGQGSFSGPSGPHPDSMPRSQPETLPSVQTLPLSGSTTSSSLYSHSTPLPPPPPAPQSSAGPSPMHSHESYNRRNSQEHSRTLPPNPYAAAPPQPVIPAIRPSDPYPAPPTNGHSSYQSSHPYPPPPPHHITSPQYPPTPSYSNGSSTSQQYPFPQHSSAPPPQSAYQPHPQPPHSTSSYSYPPRDAYPHDPPQTSPGSGGGMKRNYGSTIERALSISTLRRDFDLTKENSAKIYYIVQSCQDVAKNLQPNLLDHCLRELSDAIDCSTRNTEALRSCQQVFQELCAKEYAEQNAAQRVSTNHSSEYGGDDNHGYADDTRSNGSAQPDAKKIRRGRAAPPGRCHSCHRAETPEWRRGPDGARTLCNACGLHYAKLTRKLSKSNMNTNGSGQIAGRNAPNSPLP